MADGIGRQGVGMISCLYDSVNLNAKIIGTPNYKDIPKECLAILAKPFTKYNTFSFYTYILGLNEEFAKFHSTIDSKIKIAYSMFESDRIPSLWVDVLNKYYDMVIVPDQWLVDVYKTSGVNKPIFVIPLGIYIEEFLKEPFNTKTNDMFTFGLSAGFWERKNHIQLAKVFNKEFKNNSKLKLHGRFGSFKSQVENEISRLNNPNIELHTNAMSQKEYLEFMKSVDCYVFPSGGEGFSITPRETIALGIPCILSNNSAHKTIVNSGFVIPVKAEKQVPAKYEVFKNKQIGNFYNCDSNDLGKAMLDVKANYNKHLDKARKGREWVSQYLWSSLKPIYLNLFKANGLEFSNENKITENSWKTNDKNLFEKMKAL